MSENMSEYMPEDLSDKVPEEISNKIPDWMPEETSDKVAENIPDRMPEELPTRMPDDSPEDLPEVMPGRMPNGISKKMLDRMPDVLPIRKHIIVIVGFTGSIFFSKWHKNKQQKMTPKWEPHTNVAIKQIFREGVFLWQIHNTFFGSRYRIAKRRIPAQLWKKPKIKQIAR